jgi:hypothetical protein
VEVAVGMGTVVSVYPLVLEVGVDAVEGEVGAGGGVMGVVGDGPDFGVPVSLSGERFGESEWDE